MGIHSSFLTPEQLPAANQIIDAAAVDAGRSPDAVRRVYNIGGDFNGSGEGYLQGPPAVWIEQLTELTLVHGISGYILYRVESEDVIRRFATRWSGRYAVRLAANGADEALTARAATK